MAGKQVVVEISQTRLEMAVLSGRSIVATRLHLVDAADFAEKWPEGLARLGETLQTWVEELKLRGSPVTILYTSRDALASVFACPFSAGRAAAVRATMLAMTDAVAFPLGDNPHASERVWVDPAVKGGAAGGVARQVHTLGVADTETSTSAIVQWVQQAGLKPRTILPAQAPATVAAVRKVTQLARAKAGGTILLLRLGEHGSVLTACTGGRIRLVRNFALGTESFVDALTRPIQSQGPEGQRSALDRAAARRILFTFGIPAREQVIDEATKLEGAALLPLLQPVLQRSVVEVKQSLRFGLNEQERIAVHLVVDGFAAVIPHLAEIIAQLGGFTLQAETAAPADTDPTSSRWGSIAALAAVPGSLNISLMPRALEAKNTGVRVKRAMWAGVAAAAGFVAFDAVTTRLAIAPDEHMLDTLGASPVENDPVLAMRDRSMAVRTAVAGAEGRMRRALGQAPDWAAVMGLLADVTPATIRLNEVLFSHETADGPACSMRGYVLAGDGADTPAAIKAYIDTLSGAPIVRSVKLGTTSRSQVGGLPVQAFEVTFSPVALPVSLAATDAKPALGPPADPRRDGR